MLDKNIAKKQIMTRRTFVIGAGKIGLLFLLAGRMFYMQFIKKDEYKTLSDNNRIKMIVMSPKRGEIYDVNNTLVAKNITCFRLLLDKNGNPEFSSEIDLVTKILELDEDQKHEIQKRIRKGGRRIPVIVLDYLEWKTIAAIEERRADFKSLFIDTGFSRFYNSGISAAHLIGYLGRPRKKEGAILKLCIDLNTSYLFHFFKVNATKTITTTTIFFSRKKSTRGVKMKQITHKSFCIVWVGGDGAKPMFFFHFFLGCVNIRGFIGIFFKINNK